MIVTAPDQTASALPILPARQQVPATPPSLPASPATIPSTAPLSASALAVDTLAALLPDTDPVATTLAAADPARRYIDSGNLTPQPGRSPATTPNALTPLLAAADVELLQNLSQAYRGDATTPAPPPPVTVLREIANAQIPGAPATGSNTPPVIVIDGRTIPLTPAQAAAVRAAIGSDARKVGPGAAATDTEDPTITVNRASLESTFRDSHRVIATDASLRQATESPERHPQPQQSELADARDAARSVGEKIEAVRAVRGDHPAPYEPQLILPQPQEHLVLAPAADRVILAGQQAGDVQQTMTGIAIGMAAGITPEQIVADATTEGYRIAIAGSNDAIIVRTRVELTAQLLFADGTTLRIRVDPT